MNYCNVLFENWKSELKGKKFVIEILITVLVLIISLICYSKFLNYVEARQGAVLNDPAHSLIKPINFTLPIFIILYLLLITGIILLIRNPQKLVIAVQTYILIIYVRIIAMYLTPLDSPKDSIILIDPIVTYLGTGTQLTKDLFFSGHTATMFILFLTALSNKEKIMFLIGTVLIALFVIIQHTHYAIDVFAAPFFVYGAYRMVFLIKKRWNIYGANNQVSNHLPKLRI